MREKKGFPLGFTLIELLVVISVIAVLSAVGIVVFKGVTANARDSARIRDLQAIKQALEFYRSDNRYYPKSSGATDESRLPLLLSNTTSLTDCTGTPGFDTCTFSSTYLQLIPKDSDTLRNYYYLALPNSPVCDNNSSATACTGFILCAKKEGTNTANDLSACSSLNSCGSAGNCDIGIASQ